MYSRLYAGTVYEDVEFNNSNDNHTAPSPLQLDQQTVSSEGVFGRVPLPTFR
jgi:hypothetical protein